MMKKAMTVLLVLALCLSALAGCGKGGVNYEGRIKEGFLYETTGISPDAVVMNVDGVDVTAEEFFYWIGYGCSRLFYYAGGIDWEQDAGGMTMNEYVKDQAAQTAALYAVIKALAKENGVELSEEDKAASAADVAGMADYYGGMAAYEEEMASQGASLAMMEDLNNVMYLYENLQELYLDENSKIHPSEADANDYVAQTGAYTVKHILFDIRTCTEEEAAQKLAQAEQILQELDARGEADLEILFDGYIADYGEDPGMSSNPNGYTFGDADDASLVPGFAETSRALEEYEYSDILVTDYGYHIILRLPLDKLVLFDAFIQEAQAEAEIRYSDIYETINAREHYERLVAQKEESLAE